MMHEGLRCTSLLRAKRPNHVPGHILHGAAKKAAYVEYHIEAGARHVIYEVSPR